MRKFKTESKKLLDLMINSIYTNREIFLRELISNASDAIDKLYFRSLTDSSVSINRNDLTITVAYDADARTVTVSDNGIGMTKEELDKNLGTIAHSDSMQFKAENGEDATADIDIIGQFGVGFYSAFMVGSRVRVVSRAYGSDEAWAWESDGVEGYTIEPAERTEHGTDVVVLLKENSGDDNYDQYATEYGLTSLIKRYSNYVRYPIQMAVTKTRRIDLPTPAEGEAGETTEGGAAESAPAQPKFENYVEVETINSMIPIWKRKGSEVTREEYNEFYKTDFHDFEDPSRVITLHAEGTLTYDALLFVPSHAPYDLYSKDFKKGLALYSSNVLIMEKCEELLPDYFGFVRGVVDSADLTLNISRETLQHNGQLHAIARRIEKKVKSDLLDMRDDDREGYEKFFGDFGRALKFGIYNTYGQAKSTLEDLLLFYSAREKKLVTLEEYAAAAPEGQEYIYYATGNNIAQLAQQPMVTTVLAKGYDVLLCQEDVDEFCLMAMMTYHFEGKEDEEAEAAPSEATESEASDEKKAPKERDFTFKNVGAEDAGLATEEEKKQAEEATSANQALLDAMREALEGKVERVVVSTRQTESPAVITTEGDLSLKMEQMLQTIAIGSQEAPKSQRVLELNPQHAVFAKLQKAQEAGDADKVKLYAGILYDQALLVEGLPIEDPIAFSQAICSLME